MLPLILNPIRLKVGLIGRDAAQERRAALLAQAGVGARLLPEAAPDDLLASLDLLFVAGLPDGEAGDLATRARALGVLVNVEDRPALCDFHVPAIVRRGDLLLTASTGGQAPGLARRLRETLAQQFGPEWTTRLKELGVARARWRAKGLSPAEISRNLREMVARRDWL